MDSYGSYDAYDSYDRSNVDVWMKSYEVVYFYHFIIEKTWILFASKSGKQNCSGTWLFTEKVILKWFR